MNWQLLTPTEQRIAYLLGDVNHDSIWGIAIARYNERPTNDRLRSLIEQLTSQTIDNPTSMAKVIGWELVDALMVNIPNWKGKIRKQPSV